MSIGQPTSVLGISGTTPKIKYTTVFPDAGNFTFMCWGYHTGGTGDAYSDMFGITDLNDVIGMTLHTVGGVRKFSMGDLNSDVDGQTTIPDNVWNHFCITGRKIPGTGTAAIGYLNSAEQMSGSLINPVTPSIISLFNSRASDTDAGAVWIGNLCAFKIWTGVALRPDEIRREMWCYMAQRKAGLFACTPGLDFNARTHNYGGLAGIDWTTQSTFFAQGTNDPPGVVWDYPQGRRDISQIAAEIPGTSMPVFPSLYRPQFFAPRRRYV